MEPGFAPTETKRQDLTSNAVMEQQQLNRMVQRFPPRVCRPMTAMKKSRKCMPVKIWCSTITAGSIVPSRQGAHSDHPCHGDRSAQHGLAGSSSGASSGAADGGRSCTGGSDSADRWICPDRLRAAIHGNDGAAARCAARSQANRQPWGQRGRGFRLKVRKRVLVRAPFKPLLA